MSYKGKIANVIYAGRMGNGDTVSADGWKYRVVGAIPIFLVASVTCWVRYPKELWSRL